MPRGGGGACSGARWTARWWTAHPLRNHTADGRVLEFELSLSQRQKAGNPLAVRCLLRDVTQQKQREHRLALQLVVSQIVGENAPPKWPPCAFSRRCASRRAGTWRSSGK